MGTGLTIFHFLAIMTLFALLWVEFYLLRVEPSVSSVRTLGRVDIFYGVMSGVVIISGLLRVFLSVAGPSYYAENWAFWVKMGLFLAVGIVSIRPSLHYVRWSRAAKTNGALPDLKAIKQARLFVHIQLTLLILIPVFAVIMAG